MIAARSQQGRSEHWSGHWGADARFYARRSDGACFAIDSAVNVIDLAGHTPPSPHAQPVDALPRLGRYTLRVFGTRPLDASAVTSSDDATGGGDSPNTSRRLLACGVRRRG